MRAALAFALVFAAATDARADISAAAAARRDAGVAHYTAGRYVEAITEFEAAYELSSDPGMLFSLAQAERQAGRCKDAVPHYLKYLDSKPSADGEAAANQWIAVCDATKSSEPGACARESATPWYKNPVGGAVVGGVVLASVGVGFWIASSGNRDRADSAMTSGEFEGYLDTATAQRRIGVTFLVVGAGLVGGGIAYHFWTKKKSRGAVVGTTGASLFIAGEF